MAVTDPHFSDIDRRLDIQRHDNSLYERTGIAGWVVLILFLGGLSAILYIVTLQVNPSTIRADRADGSGFPGCSRIQSTGFEPVTPNSGNSMPKPEHGSSRAHRVGRAL